MFVEAIPAFVAVLGTLWYIARDLKLNILFLMIEYGFVFLLFLGLGWLLARIWERLYWVNADLGAAHYEVDRLPDEKNPQRGHFRVVGTTEFFRPKGGRSGSGRRP